MAPGLFAPSAPEKERLALMSKYLHPAPGSPLNIEQADLRERGENNSLHMRGYITVSPPKGHCFVVSRGPDLADRNVCKEERLAFKIQDLQRDGTLSWQISTGVGDPGFTYHWPTPYRVAQVILAGETRDRLHDSRVITRCTAQNYQGRRRVLLELADGKLWTIRFPDRDQAAPQPASPANLFVDNKKESTDFTETDISKTEEKPDYIKARENAALNEPVTTYWTMPFRHAFLMSADNFHSRDAPPGLIGQCLYRFSGAPQDAESGWIECMRTSEFEVVLAPISCAKAMRDDSDIRELTR